MRITKTQLKEMVRKAIRKQLAEQRGQQQGNGKRARQMMNQIIKTAGPENFSQEFIDRMGPDLEDDIRAVLSYIARRLDVEL